MDRYLTFDKGQGGEEEKHLVLKIELIWQSEVVSNSAGLLGAETGGFMQNEELKSGLYSLLNTKLNKTMAKLWVLGGGGEEGVYMTPLYD
jgi:hypothetical protein